MIASSFYPFSKFTLKKPAVSSSPSKPSFLAYARVVFVEATVLYILAFTQMIPKAQFLVCFDLVNFWVLFNILRAADHLFVSQWLLPLLTQLFDDQQAVSSEPKYANEKPFCQAKPQRKRIQSGKDFVYTSMPTNSSSSNSANQAGFDDPLLFVGSILRPEGIADLVFDYIFRVPKDNNHATFASSKLTLYDWRIIISALISAGVWIELCILILQLFQVAVFSLGHFVLPHRLIYLWACNQAAVLGYQGLRIIYKTSQNNQI